MKETEHDRNFRTAARLGIDLKRKRRTFRLDTACVQEGLAELHAGDKGMLLEDFRTEMTAKTERLKQQITEVAA